MKSTALPTNLKDWLAHRSALPPKNKGRGMKKVSDKRKGELAEYRKLRDKFLADNPRCQGKHYVGVCSENFVGQAVHGCFNKSVDLHHRAGRIGAKLTDVKDFVALCRKCHTRVHEHPTEARALNLLK